MSAPKINLIFYTIRFREKRQKKGVYEPFDKLFPGKSFIEFIDIIISDFMNKVYVTEDKEKIMDIISLNKHIKDGPKNIIEENYLFGRLCKGVKPKTVNNIRSINTKKEDGIPILNNKSTIIKKIEDDEYPTFEYFYLFCNPKKEGKILLTKGLKDTGLLATQSFEIYGYKDLFEEVLKKYFAKYLGDKYTVEINPLMLPELMIKYIEDKSFKSIILRKHSIPKEFNAIFEEQDIPENVEIETALKPKGGVSWNAKNRLISKLKDDSIHELLPDDFDDISVEVKTGKTYRTVSLSNPNRFSSVFDVTNEFKYKENDEIDSIAAYKIAKDIIENILLSYQ